MLPTRERPRAWKNAQTVPSPPRVPRARARFDHFRRRRSQFPRPKSNAVLCFEPLPRVNPGAQDRLEELMGRAFRRSDFVEPLESRVLRSATPVVLTDPGHNLHVLVGEAVNLDPTSSSDADYVKPLSVKWDLNYDGAQVDADRTGEQPRVAFDHAGHFVVAGEYVYGDHTELHTFAVDVSDLAIEPADPAIHIAAADHASPGESITLALTTDHIGETVQYVLENGDGYSGPANEPAEISTSFAKAGTYQLKIQLYVDGEYVGYAAHTVIVATPTAEVAGQDASIAYVSQPGGLTALVVAHDKDLDQSGDSDLLA
jgi:hypothetical protein